MSAFRRALAVFLAFAAVASVAAGVSEADDIISRLSRIRQPYPPFKVLIWTDKKIYSPGDEIQFCFTSEKDCYLTMIDISTDGRLRVIFPNSFSRDNFVKGGRSYNIPLDYGFSMNVEGPAGREKVKLIATTTKMDIFDMEALLGQGGEAFVEDGPESEKFRGVRDLEKKLDDKVWTEAEAEFEIK